MYRQMETDRMGKIDLQRERESLKEDVLKLTILHKNIRGWILHLSTRPACCHGDQLQGQQWGGNVFNVCLCLYVSVKFEFVNDYVDCMCDVCQNCG